MFNFTKHIMHKLSDLDETRENIARTNLRKLAKQNGHAVLTVNLSVGEFAAVRWASSIFQPSLDLFMRAALRDKVRTIAQSVNQRGGDIPQTAAEFLGKD